MISETILDLGISIWSLVAHIYHKSNAYLWAKTKKKKKKLKIAAEAGISVKAQSAVVHWQDNLSWLRIIIFISLYHTN